MNSEDLRSLAERAETIEGRQADRLAEVHDRIRTAQRRRATAASVGLAGLVLALIVGFSALTGSTERSQDPVEPPTPTPTPTETESATIPDGQFTQAADISAGDIKGWRTVATRTNRQPDFLGTTDLSTTVTLAGGLDGGGAAMSEFCQGSPDTWYALRYGNGGHSYGRCSPDDSLPVRPEHQYIGPFSDPRGGPSETSIRMFVAKPSPEWVDCYTNGGRGCAAVLSSLQPLDSTDAEFGFVVHEHPAVPPVLDVLGTSFEALAITDDGDEYLVDSAVVAEADAATLVVPFDPSDRVRLVAVYTTETPSTDRCRLRHDTEGLLTNPDIHTRTELATLDRQCVADLELRVDGQLAGPEDEPEIHFSVPDAAIVPAGGAHEVTVNVAKNDPRNVRFAVVIWQAR